MLVKIIVNVWWSTCLKSWVVISKYELSSSSAQPILSNHTYLGE